MYVTQSNFMRTQQSPGDGLLEPIDESREAAFRTSDASALGRTLVYPNRWQEERNLRSLHKEQYHNPIHTHVSNKKYLEVSEISQFYNIKLCFIL